MMDFDLVDKVAVVSGASRGIGKAIATTLACEGACVMLVARTKKHLDDAVAEVEARAPGRVDAVVADMTEPREVADAVGAARARFGPISITVSLSLIQI